METIVLISCAKEKRKVKSKAKDLYISELFANSLKYSHTLNPDRIYILSALHYVLDPETEIEPYNVTLSYVSPKKREADLKVLSTKERREWARIVTEQLENKCDLDSDLFIVLAGNRYIEFIRPKIKNLREPLKGLRQGERNHYLIEKINEHNSKTA